MFQEGCQENEFEDHLVEEQDVVPSSRVDQSTKFLNIPRYDELDDLLEKPILYASSEGESFQEDNDVIQPTWPDCNMIQNNEMQDNKPLYDDYASQSEDEREVFHGIVQVKAENFNEVDPICQEEVKWHDYHDQQTPEQEAPFFISAVSPLAESEIDLLSNINSQVNPSKFDKDL